MTTLSKKAGKHADLQRDPCPRSNKPKRYGPEDDNTLCLPRSKVFWLLAKNVNPAHVFNEGSFHQSDWFTVLAMVRMFHNDNRLPIVLGPFSEKIDSIQHQQGRGRVTKAAVCAQPCISARRCTACKASTLEIAPQEC